VSLLCAGWQADHGGAAAGCSSVSQQVTCVATRADSRCPVTPVLCRTAS
jgi:hypothetical protein